MWVVDSYVDNSCGSAYRVLTPMGSWIWNSFPYNEVEPRRENIMEDSQVQYTNTSVQVCMYFIYTIKKQTPL